MPDSLNLLNPNLEIFPELGRVKEGDNMFFEFSFERGSEELNDSQLDLLDLKIEPFAPVNELFREAPVITPPEGSTGNFQYRLRWRFDTTGNNTGAYRVTAIERMENEEQPINHDDGNFQIEQPLVSDRFGVKVSMRQTVTPVTNDITLWLVILKSTEALKFDNYNKFVNLVLCGVPVVDPVRSKTVIHLGKKRFLPFTDTDAYRHLKIATEAFVMTNCGVVLEEPSFSEQDLFELRKRLVLSGGPKNSRELEAFWQKYLVTLNGSSNITLPYLSIIRTKLTDQSIKKQELGQIIERLAAQEQREGVNKQINDILNQGTVPSDRTSDTPQNGELTGERCVGIIGEKLTQPCLVELIWSYWMEEAMLVQTLSAISRRFQNIRSKSNDPLANMEIAPLRLLNNLLWGYIQDEQHRLGVKRRAYEYDHHYGFSLQGKAIPKLQTVDSRTKFLEAFHNLLHLTTGFYKQADDTTVIADAFPLLNALKEVHLILAEGAHNQFGDLPATSRIEMLMQQWLLARPEFREFLPTRTMVAYPEPWMDRVAAMNQLQGWTDTNLINFLNLAIFGEQLLLSIRFGAWSEINDRRHAENWANFWREQIQGYIHAYRAATGVDLTAATTRGKIDSRPPSYHLLERLKSQLNGKSQHQVSKKARVRKNTKV